MNEKRTIGNFGENAACQYLENKGLKIIKRNYHCRVGELDIIASDGESLVFVEVKTRKSSSYGRASEYVDYRKQQKIIGTALYYIGSDDYALRFDVIEVYYCETPDGFEIYEINHIENAFC